MSIQKLLVLLSLICVVATGCGSENASAPKSSETAAAAKQQIDKAVSQITQSPATASNDLGLLLESLEAYARDYGGPFKDLLETAKSVQSELNGKPDQSKLESELGRLTAAANKLVDASK